VKRVFKRFLFFCLLFSPALSYALENTINWLPPHQNLRVRINLDTKQFEQEESSDTWVMIRPLLIDEQDFATLLAKPNHADYFFITKNTIRLVIQGTGLVYDFDTQTATLKRVDRTLHSGYNFGATRFIRKNTLYSIGGEGFWSYNKHITYFDEKVSKEWELLRPKNLGPEMISSGFLGYSPSEDAFYSGGSIHKNFLEDEKLSYPREIQRFNFATKSWEILGNISSALPLEEHRAIFWNGTHFVHLARDRAYIIDPKKNEVYQYLDNSTYFEANGEFYVSGDTIKYFHFAHRGPLSIIPVNELLKKSTYIGRFYEPDYSPYYLGGAGLLILIGVFYWVYTKKRKLEPSFDQLERKLLKALVESGDNYIPTNELNEILDCANKSQENQRRIRFMTIKQVNEKLAFYYNIKNAIERTASTEDKRLITYRLKKGVKEKIKAIL
jgi:hypothetical protein